MSTNTFKASQLPPENFKMSQPQGNDKIRHADIRLFDTGDLADATIVCGDRTWKVHKVIVSSRCKWFKAAFYGNMAVSLLLVC